MHRDRSCGQTSKPFGGGLVIEDPRNLQLCCFSADAAYLPAHWRVHVSQIHMAVLTTTFTQVGTKRLYDALSQAIQPPCLYGDQALSC